MTRVGMGRHLRGCEDRRKQIAAAASRSSGTFLHLQVQDAYSGRYWLHLEMAGSAALRTLDRYLRAIWLECCGHLSRFTVGDPWRGDEISTGARAERVFEPGLEILHIYDFGTSSETRIKVLDGRSGGATTKRPIALMARNEPPRFPCMDCDRSAVWLCMQCVFEEDLDGTLCEAHAGYTPTRTMASRCRS